MRLYLLAVYICYVWLFFLKQFVLDKCLCYAVEMELC